MPFKGSMTPDGLGALVAAILGEFKDSGWLEGFRGREVDAGKDRSSTKQSTIDRK
jgi:hypothetical protein